MTILLVLFILLVILIFLFHYTAAVKEGFQDIQPPSTLDTATVQGYNNFLSFYTTFCANWQKAIQTSVASEIPQQPLTDPSQVSSTAAPNISEADMNTYIVKLSQQLGQPFPPICTTLPTEVDSTNIQQVAQIIPTDPQPYTNALNWMNTNLSNAHGNLGTALQGQSAEGFEDVCQDISQCLANNPQLAQQIAQGVIAQQQQQHQQQEQALMTNLNPFINNPSLQQILQQNQDLVQKSQDIQNQAQSGELLNQMNLPGEQSTWGAPQIPDGGYALQEMKQNNPDRYNELKSKFGQWFDVKTLIEQINSSL